MAFASYIHRITRLRLKFLLFVLPPVVVSFFLFSIIFSIITFYEKEQDVIASLNNHARAQAVIMAKALWNVNFDTVDAQIRSITLIPVVSGVKVTEFTTQKSLYAGLYPKDDASSAFLKVKYDLIYETQNKRHRIGELHLFSSKQNIYALLMRSFTRDALLLLLLVTAIIASAVWANKLIIDTPLRRFLTSIHKADQEHVREPVFWDSQDELGAVIQAYNQMLGSLNATEKELRTSEAYYRTVFETTSTATAIIEADRTIAHVNSRFEKLSGYRKDEIEGKLQTEVFIFEDDRQRLRQYHERRRKHPHANPSEYEFRFVDRSGVTKHIYTQVDMIPGTQRSIAALMDITFLKKAEKALKQEKEKFQILVEKAPLGIALISKDSRYLYINPQFTEIFGYTLDDIPKGRQWFEKAFPDPDYRREVISMWIQDLETYDVGRPRPRVVSVQCKNGVQKAIHFRTVGMEGGQQFVICEDITQRKKLEEQLQHAQKMETIGTLAGGVAHDFNNLLMGVEGRTSLMLAREDLYPEFRSHLEEIERYVKSAANLTQQLMGFARGGKYVVKPTNLNQLIHEQNRMFSRTRKEINIHESLPDDLWLCEVDAGQIEQVLLNLYINAWQAMPRGGDLFTKTENRMADKQDRVLYGLEKGRWVQITVTDTGVGMDASTRQRIFDPFFTTKKLERGAGLGLASVYGIIKNHGGSIHVDSQEGQGATFTIFLPASDAETIDAADTPPSASQTQPVEKGRETVLLIDDEDIITDVSQEMLSDLGYEVLTANSGREAIEIFRQKKTEVNLVVLDLIMPDMGGEETFEQLKQLNPDVKVLLSSGYSMDDQASALLNHGCQGFIQKPFNLDQLSQKMRAILD